MTTQELRSYIDRILGNSLRVLLPSYWWKRLFGMVADKIDEVDSGLSRKITNADAKIDTVDSVLRAKIDEVAESVENQEPYIFYYDSKNELSSEYKNKNIATLDAIKRDGITDNIYVLYIYSWVSSQPLGNLSKSIVTRSGLDQDIFTLNDIPTTLLGRSTKRMEFDWRPNGDIWVEDAPMEFDAEMSDISINAVQNKVVKAYVDNAVANAGGTSSGGSSVLRMWYNDENTDEQIEENIQVYNKLLNNEAICVLVAMEGSIYSSKGFYFYPMDSYYVEDGVVHIWAHDVFYEVNSLVREDYHFLLYSDGSWDIA